jgi:YHS domain-containing protein
MNLRPPGAKESLMQEMCEPLRKYKNEHIKVIWVRSGPHGKYRGVAFTRTYFCSEVLKENFKALP